MKMRDTDNSVLALYYVYCAHPIRECDGKSRLKVYSQANEEQYFYYTSAADRDLDLEFIHRWIEAREMGVSTE